MGNPTVTCDKCGSQMTVQPVGNGFPPKVFANRLRKQCREKGCDGEPPFEMKPDHPDWIKHMLTDDSWQEWRDENPGQVEHMRSEYGIA